MKSLLSIIIILFITACNSTGTTTDTLTQNDPTASETPTEILTPKLYKISIKAGSVGTGTAAFGEFPLSIKVGDTVIWQNDDTLNHDFSDIQGNDFWCQLKPTQNCSYTFKYPGTFDYEDLFYQAGSMSGRIVVSGN